MKIVPWYIFAIILAVAVAIAGGTGFKAGENAGIAAQGGALTTCLAEKVAAQDSARLADASARSELEAEYKRQLKERDDRLANSAKTMAEYVAEQQRLVGNYNAAKERLRRLSEVNPDAKTLLDTDIRALRVFNAPDTSGPAAPDHRLPGSPRLAASGVRAALRAPDAGECGSRHRAEFVECLADRFHGTGGLRSSSAPSLALR